MEKKFTQNGITVVFYQKDGDAKFSFLIENNEELTEKLLATVSKKRVAGKSIFFAKEAIFNLINNNQLKEENEMGNPIVELSEICQKRFGDNIEVRVVSKEGADHCPIIKVEIQLPNGDVFEGSGSNKKIAKQNAAIEALASW